MTHAKTRFLTAAKYVAVLLVAVPALGIAFLLLREGVAESGGMSLNAAFHLGLGLWLLLILSDSALAIRRSGRFEVVLLIGTGGFLAALLGAILSELLGPPMLLLLIVGGAVWTFALWRQGDPGDYERACVPCGDEMDTVGGIR